MGCLVEFRAVVQFRVSTHDGSRLKKKNDGTLKTRSKPALINACDPYDIMSRSTSIAHGQVLEFKDGGTCTVLE